MDEDDFFYIPPETEEEKNKRLEEERVESIEKMKIRECLLDMGYVDNPIFPTCSNCEYSELISEHECHSCCKDYSTYHCKHPLTKELKICVFVDSNCVHHKMKK